MTEIEELDVDELEFQKSSLEKQRDLLLTACRNVAQALGAMQSGKGLRKSVFDKTWNPDAHLEITLTIAEARAVYSAIEYAEIFT